MMRCRLFEQHLPLRSRGILSVRSPHIAADGLFGMSVAAIIPSWLIRLVARRRLCGGHHRVGMVPATKMNVHLGIQHAFESGLHHQSHEIIDIVDRRGLASHVTSELLGLVLEDRIQA